MKFYGFYISKNKESLRKKIIETGVLPFEELIKGKAEKTYSEMLDDLENQPVFLFSGFANEKMKDSPFAEYLSEDEYNLESNVSIYKSYAKGVIQSIDPTTKNILIKWDKDYQPVTWYRYTFSEPIWGLDTTKNQIQETLFQIIFENKDMDYKWWAENLSWYDKRQGNFHYSFNEEPRVFKNVYELPKAAIEWLIEHNKFNYDQLKKLIESTDSDTTAIVKLKSDFSNLSEEHKSKYISNSIKDLEGNEFHVSNQWGRAGASKNKWDNFIQNCAKGGLEIKENRDAVAIMQTSNIENSSQLKTASLNQILYGPPGTGKTYSTVKQAMQILAPEIDESLYPESIQALKDQYAGQIEFVTFHQSFSYEDFVEGIQAKSLDGNLHYSVEKGVFLKICSRAAENLKLSQKSRHEQQRLVNLDGKLNGFLSESMDSKTPFEKKKGAPFIIQDIKDDALIIHSPDSVYSQGIIEVKLDSLKAVVESGLDLNKPMDIANQVFNKTNPTQADSYLLSLSHAFKNYDFQSNQTHDPVNLKNYVLIIDEINRGNISRIFGELITLIEDSKRQGSAEAVSVQLPYSKESFSVPNNLYIIGTMNTADRSLAMMDTALRRRFDFIEMMPNANLLDDYGDAGYVDGVDLVQLLAIINKRIEALYDREHTIGHAFFMSLNENSTIGDLANIFKNKILPLLEEYFYDDWEKIRLVLADQTKSKTSELQFYREVEGINQDALFPKSNGSALSTVNKSYRRHVSSLPEAYIRIYEIRSTNSIDEDGSSE